MRIAGHGEEEVRFVIFPADSQAVLELGIVPVRTANAHWDKTQLYWYFSNLCEDRKKICKRVQHNISIITACDIQVIGVRPRGFLY